MQGSGNKPPQWSSKVNKSVYGARKTRKCSFYEVYKECYKGSDNNIHSFFHKNWKNMEKYFNISIENLEQQQLNFG